LPSAAWWSTARRIQLFKDLNAWENKLLGILREHGGTPLAKAQLTKTQAMARALQRPALAAALEALDEIEVAPDGG
jgi:hypothetical protein